MIRCSMIGAFARRCPNPADVQLRVDRQWRGVDCGFVITICNDTECLKRYVAAAECLQNDGATLSTMILPRAAVVALKQELERKND